MKDEHNYVNDKISATDFILKSSKRYNGNLTIICLGPLTNISDCIDKDKEFVKRINKFVCLGGTLST